jgi:hypothetical protein
VTARSPVLGARWSRTKTAATPRDGNELQTNKQKTCVRVYFYFFLCIIMPSCLINILTSSQCVDQGAVRVGGELAKYLDLHVLLSTIHKSVESPSNVDFGVS